MLLLPQDLASCDFLRLGRSFCGWASAASLLVCVAGCSSNGSSESAGGSGNIAGSNAAGAPGTGGGSGGDSGNGSAAGSGNTAGMGGDGAAGGGSPTTQKLSGGFSVNLDGLSSVTMVGGNVYDAEAPTTVIWTKRASVGDCELSVPSQPFCDPSCGSSACIEGNQCVPHPKPVSVGDVTVRGVGAAEFSMSPKGDSFYYVPPPGVTIPYPPAADGAAIRFEVAGGSFGPFVLEAESIAPLEITSSNPLSIKDGEPLVVTWTPGASAGARVSLELDLSHHGGTKGRVVCEVADTGSVSIASELVKELVGLGLSGFPTLDIERRFTGTTPVAAGTVELSVRSAQRLDVNVPGLVSCSGPEDCPEGQTCQDDLQCK